MANARQTRKSHYVWIWAGDYWCDTLPPSTVGTAGVYPENVDVVYPEGHYEPYSDVLARNQEASCSPDEKSSGNEGPAKS